MAVRVQARGGRRERRVRDHSEVGLCLCLSALEERGGIISLNRREKEEEEKEPTKTKSAKTEKPQENASVGQEEVSPLASYNICISEDNEDCCSEPMML